MRKHPRCSSIAAAFVAFALSAAASAQAEVVAGWDFSQYYGNGLLSIDGATYTGVLSANYSNLDPTFNAGAESAAFGTMYIDGQFGSTSVPLGQGTEQVLPTTEVVASNIDAPVQVPGDIPFDTLEVLVSEGQQFANSLAMIASAPVDVVFRADKGAPASGNWSVSFGARAFTGTSTMTVDFSTTGSGYAHVATIPLDEVDTRYEVDLGPADGQLAFVRFGFDPSGANQPVFDNVAIVPEPGAAAQLVAAVAGLAICARRRA